MTKAETIAALGNQMSSFYSLEQVINIVNNIDEKGGISKRELEIAIDNIVESLERNSQEILDYTDVEFSINYDHRIEVDSIGIDFDYIRQAIENNLDGLVKEDDLVELERGEN